MPAKSIEQVLAEHTGEWMAIPGVVGVGIGLCDDQPCIRVYVAERTPEVSTRIPSTQDGYRVDVEMTGEIRALDSE